MLIYASLDPDVFDSSEHSEPGYGENLAALCRGIQHNGVLICDNTGAILTRLGQLVPQLPPKHVHRVRTWLEELLKAKKRRVVARDTSALSISDPTDHTELAAAIALDTHADALITTEYSLFELTERGCPHGPALLIHEYATSPLEDQRNAFTCGVSSLDQFTHAEFEELLGRATRFTKWLTVYDKQIGKANNTQAFLQGIVFLVDAWVNHSHYDPSELERLTIVTGTASRVDPAATPTTVSRARAANRAVIARLDSDLVAPLQAKYPFLQIKLVAKEDPRRIFHMRLLATEHTVISVERGFDFFDVATSQLMPCILHIPLDGRSLIHTLQALADAK